MTPENSKLRDPLERKRLAALFNQGLDEPTGYALPIKHIDLGDRDYWQTGPWPFRVGMLLLIPGDSPMGFRIPLDSLPWSRPEEIEPDLDPFEDLGPLAGKRKRKADAKDAPREIIHTALCVEPREGRLYVFMPPVNRLEPYLELIVVGIKCCISFGN